MAFQIAFRHEGDIEGTTVNRRFETFDEAWNAAKLLADDLVSKFNKFELKFERVD